MRLFTNLLVTVILLPLMANQSLSKPSTSTPIAKQVEQVNIEFFRALSKKDQTVLSKRIADDAVFSGLEAETKASLLNSIRKSKVASIELEDWTVKVQREMVVVIGEAIMRDDKKKSIPIGFMNVFVNRKGVWQISASYVAATPSEEDEVNEVSANSKNKT